MRHIGDRICGADCERGGVASYACGVNGSGNVPGTPPPNGFLEVGGVMYDINSLC
jgi:hypothetical protein